MSEGRAKRQAPSGVITLLTDFGSKDPFVGIMKGVIVARCPGARIIDLCHGIAPQDVVEAAFWLDRSYRWFPPGTVHVAVVDPGVGSQRTALALYAHGHYFVGPDNGLFSGPLGASDTEARTLDLQALGLAEPSRTFHGRDVFAPAAAELASGRLAFAALGRECASPRSDLLPRCSEGAAAIEGEVLTVDGFGNLITNIEADLVARLGPARAHVAGAECRLVGTYSEVAPGELAALINSFQTLEIAVRDGNAAGRLGARRGTRVLLASERAAGP
jgi:S-adenosylmethionine hydrolase